MSRISCRRATRWLDERALGCELSVRQRMDLDAHLADCAACAEREVLDRGLQQVAREAPLSALPPLIERRMLAARDPALTTHVPRSPSVRGWVTATAVATTAMALAALAFVGIGGLDRGDRSGVVLSPTTDVQPLPEPPGDVDRSDSVREPAKMACASPGTALWVEPGAAVGVVSNDAQGARFQLDSGRVVAEIGDNERGYLFVVETPNLVAEARGTVFAVEVDAGGNETVRVLEGTVEVREPSSGLVAAVTAGLQLRRGDGETSAIAPDMQDRDLTLAGLDRVSLAERKAPAALPPEATLAAPAAPASVDDRAAKVERRAEALLPVEGPTVEGPTVEDLTRQARSHHAAREFDLACAAYRQLIESYPDSAAARNTEVALGQIELSANDRPEPALGHFDRYLALQPRGALSEESRLGRVRALSALGRHEEVGSAVEEFLARHPDSSARPEALLMRGDAHRLAGRLEAAAADYREVVDRWPGSAQAAVAQRRLTDNVPSR